MLQFDEYKVKLNNLRPELDELDQALGLETAIREVEMLEDGSRAHVTLREGKFHQVKRMMASRGTPVTYLERVRMGNLHLDPALARGAFRFLTAKEVEDLREISTSL